MADQADHETFRQEYVKCGKSHCRSCPHGPYWYAYRKVGGKLRKRYVGKERLDQLEREAPAVRDPFSYLDTSIRTIGWTLELALEILEVGPMASLEECRRSYRHLMLRHFSFEQPDISHRKRLTAAIDYILSRYSTGGSARSRLNAKR